MESQINNKKSGVCKFIKKLLFGLSIFIVVIIMAFGFLRYKSLQEQKRTKQFLHQIIDSIRNNTEFYKENSAQSAFRDLDILKNNVDKLSGHYDITIMDYDWGTWACQITFDSKTIFYADVSFVNDSPILGRFILESPLR